MTSDVEESIACSQNICKCIVYNRDTSENVNISTYDISATIVDGIVHDGKACYRAFSKVETSLAISIIMDNITGELNITDSDTVNFVCVYNRLCISRYIAVGDSHGCSIGNSSFIC